MTSKRHLTLLKRTIIITIDRYWGEGGRGHYGTQESNCREIDAQHRTGIQKKYGKAVITSSINVLINYIVFHNYEYILFNIFFNQKKIGLGHIVRNERLLYFQFEVIPNQAPPPP